jgi:predicted neuraminidase
VSENEPKTAYELILERLKQKDRAEGVLERTVTDRQKSEIAAIRKVYDARLAEREILHQADRRKAAEPEALEHLEEDYRRDRERIASERDRKIEQVRKR